MNTEVFQDPYTVMRNIELVTEVLKEQGQTTLEFQRSLTSGELLFEDSSSGLWRCSDFLQDSTTHNSGTPVRIYSAARCFAQFALALKNDERLKTLRETIQHFHHTPKRYEHYLEAKGQANLKRRDSNIEAFLDAAPRNFSPYFLDGLSPSQVQWTGGA